MTLFPEWQEAHKDDPKLPERIRSIRAVYGKRDDKKCKDCKWLQVHRQGTRWFKCGKSKITGGTGTDWRARWPACGLFEEEAEGST